jgi:hypothetical protein
VGIRKGKKKSVQGVSSSITNFAASIPDETVTVAAAYNSLKFFSFSYAVSCIFAFQELP